MKIKRVRLHPFGNITDESFEFDENCTNVLLGETGAGKTTVFDALYGAFFIDSDVSKASPEYKKKIKKRFPLDGSNVAKVTVVFEHRGDEYELNKKWSKSRENNNVSLGGDSISKLEGDEEVKKILDDVLPTNKGTFKNVLMAYQTGLNDIFSIEEDDERSQVYNTLDDILREEMMAGGVSPKEFLEIVEEKYGEYAKRWDFDKDLPKLTTTGDRYKNYKGKIANSYVEMEDAESELRELKDKEGQIDDLNKQLNDKKDKLNDVKKFLKENKKAYEDSNEREKIELRLENKRTEFDNLEEDFQSWKNANNTISENKGSLKILNKNLDKSKSKKEKLEKSLEILNIDKEISIEEDKLESSELDSIIKAKEDIAIKVKKDTETEANEYNISRGKQKNIKSKGVLKLSTDYIDLNVKSGGENFEKVVNRIEELEEKKQNKVEEYDIEPSGGSEKVSKELEEVSEEIRENKSEIKEAKDSIKKANEMIDNIKEKHDISSINEISDMKSDVKKEKEDIKQKLEGLEDIPSGYDDVTPFKEQYEEYRDEMKDDLNSEIQNLLSQLKDIDVPETSSEELKEEIKNKEKEYDQALRTGKAYKFLKEKAEELMEGGDHIYGKLKNDIERYIASIYQDDYDKVKMDEMEFEGLEHPDGYTIPEDYLSTGQKDITALALRLSMAEYYLKDEDGFLVMDDPLVNIDPGKRKNAADVISEIAKEHQIFMMTCDKAHAELFTDSKITEV